MAERSFLGITDGKITATKDHFELFRGDEESLVRGISLRIHNEQPDLFHHHLRYGHRGDFDPRTYKLGASLTYDLIPEIERKEGLDRRFIHHAYRIIRQVVPDKSGQIFQSPNNKLSDEWFNHLFIFDPTYLSWLIEFEDDLINQNGGSDFTQGSVSIYLPFYLRKAVRTI